MSAPLARFDGRTYDHARDHARLTSQLVRVREVMRDGQWRTLKRIADDAHAPEASVSARLRDLRKERNGAWIVESMRDDREPGVWWYRLKRRAS